MKARNIFYIVMLATVFLLMVASRHLPKNVIVGALFALICISVVRSFIVLRRVQRTRAPMVFTPVQRAGRIAIYATLFGVMAGVVLVMLHMRPVGHLLLNVSVMLGIVGLTLLFLFPGKVSDPAINVHPEKITRIARIVLYSCMVGLMAGALLKVDHYPIGRPVFFVSTTALLTTMIAFLAYTRIKGKKRVM